MELCKLIYAKRKDKGLSQEKLAEEIGVARQTISKWETGETLPDAESLKRLAEALDFSVDDALGLETGGDGGDDRLERLIKKTSCSGCGNLHHTSEGRIAIGSDGC